MINVNILLTEKQRDSLERILGMSQTDILDMPYQFMIELLDHFECELLFKEVVAKGDNKNWQLQIIQRLKEVFEQWVNTMGWPDNVIFNQEGRRYEIDDWFKNIEYDIHSNRLIKSEQGTLFAEIEGQNNQNKEIADFCEKTNGLTPKQAALFGHALAEFCKFTQKRKRDDLAPMVNKLFGWGAKSIYNKMTEGYSDYEREDIAQVFDNIWPEFANYLRTFDKRH